MVKKKVVISWRVLHEKGQETAPLGWWICPVSWPGQWFVCVYACKKSSSLNVCTLYCIHTITQFQNHTNRSEVSVVPYTPV